eukprot:5142115-Pleurochrysis_carterae.AAC.1
MQVFTPKSHYNFDRSLYARLSLLKGGTARPNSLIAKIVIHLYQQAFTARYSNPSDVPRLDKSVGASCTAAGLMRSQFRRASVVSGNDDLKKGK